MKKTILICGLLVVGLALLGGCHEYDTRADFGANYYNDYGDSGYPSATYDSSYPYYYPYPAYPAYAYPYYPYYPYFGLGLGFGFSNIIIDGRFGRGGRFARGGGFFRGGRAGGFCCGGGRAFRR
jgi:hypothetical protein